MSSIINTVNQTSIPQSISVLVPEDVAMVSAKPTVIRLHAHSEALEDSLSRSSRDKRSPQASDALSSSPQKQGSSPSEDSSLGDSPSKIVGRRTQSRFNTLPLPVRADSKIEISEREKMKDSTKKDSIWAISGVKLENFCKNLLKIPKKKQSKDISSSRFHKNSKTLNNGQSDSDKNSPEKMRLTRTSSEPRTTGKSRFYAENLENIGGIFPAEVAKTATADIGKVKKKDRFLKKKAKSASLLQRNFNGKPGLHIAPTTQVIPAPIKIKIRESQSTSSDDAFSPVFLTKRDEMLRLSQRVEHAAHRSIPSGETSKPSIFRTPSPSTGQDGYFQNHSRFKKNRSSDQPIQVKIQKFEYEPRRRSHFINEDIESAGVENDFEGDEDHPDEPTGSGIKNDFQKLPSTSSSKFDRTLHDEDDNAIMRRKTDVLVNNGTGTGIITSGESFITTSPVSGERSTLSDSGYSVTSNDLLLTDTGYVVLDSVGTASKIRSYSTLPRNSEGVKNVNAGYIHSPTQKREYTNTNTPGVSNENQSTVINPSIASQGRYGLNDTSVPNEDQFSNYCNTFPQAKNPRKTTESLQSNDPATGSLNFPHSEIPDDVFTYERSRLSNRSFSKQEFETIKHRAKSVEITITKRSKQKSGRKRACSISRERSFVTVTTRTEETRYPKFTKSEDDFADGKTDMLRQSRSSGKSVHFYHGSGASVDHEIKTEHKEMQTSPDKMFMTTDFPFTNEESQVGGQDESFAIGRQTIFGKITDNPSKFNIHSSRSSADHHTTESSSWDFTATFNETKSSNDNKKNIKCKPINEEQLTVNDFISHKSQKTNQKMNSTGLVASDRSDKHSAVSYFDGSEWLTLSSDEATSEDDQKKNALRIVKTGKRSGHTQTSEEDFYHLRFLLRQDQFSQTPPLLTSFDLNLTHPCQNEISADRDILLDESINAQNRRDSVKSIIAHEYGEMYSIFREIPPTLTFLRASLLSTDISNEDLKQTLEEYPSLRPGPWSWSQSSAIGFGFLLPFSIINRQYGKKIYDLPGTSSELISYRFEPVMEYFVLIG